MANKSFRLDDKSLKILNYLGRSQHFDTYTDVIKLGLELVAKRYGVKLEATPVLKVEKQAKFKTALEKSQDSMQYEYLLVRNMKPEEVDDYQDNYKGLGMSIKDYWVSQGKELL